MSSQRSLPLVGRSRSRHLLRWIVLACLASSPAGAAQVFHSPKDNGAPGSTIPEGGVQSVFLYLDGGAQASLPGSACNDGAGDEVCGFDLELTGRAGLTFSSFVPDVGADLLVNFSASSLRINGLDSEAPTPGPQRIGELLVNATAGGGVELTSGEAVGADLSSEVFGASTLVTVPEPGRVLILVSGIAALLVFSRRRAVQ